MQRLVVSAVGVLALAACKPATAPAASASAAPISEADAAKIADATVAAWTSMDAAKIKALYAPTVDGFDFTVPGLAGDKAAWDKRQDVFASAKFDASKEIERKVQILDADTFVMSGTWTITSTANPQYNGDVRCTDVFEKDADGKWSVVNEHCSPPPKAA